MAALPYYYDNQIKRYILQFMEIFTGLQVMTGIREDNTTKMLEVPIRYGDSDKIVANIKSAATQNKMLRLPIMSTAYTGFQLDPSLRKGISYERKKVYLERGGVYPNDIKVSHQYMPIPYRLETEVSIYTSNIEQQLQILEQLLVLFDPTLQLQTNDNYFDWTKMTTVTLENIGLENNYPIGSDKNIRVISLLFSLPIYLAIPANIRKDYIADILVRIGVVKTDSNTPEEIIADLDAQGLDYEKWFDLSEVDINKIQ